MTKILYLFITCQKNFDNKYPKILSMMNKLNYTDYLIVVGGYNTNSIDLINKVLKLNCNDFYEGLPEKVIKSLKYVYENLYKYDFYCKLDDDVDIYEIMPNTLLSNYSGTVSNQFTGDRRWHIGKCSTFSKFNTTEYKGIYVPWCSGGDGYFLSYDIMKYVVNDTTYFDEIYEDLYIAKLLRINKIYPTHIPNIYTYMKPNDK